MGARDAPHRADEGAPGVGRLLLQPARPARPVGGGVLQADGQPDRIQGRGFVPRHRHGLGRQGERGARMGLRRGAACTKVGGQHHGLGGLHVVEVRPPLRPPGAGTELRARLSCQV